MTPRISLEKIRYIKVGSSGETPACPLSSYHSSHPFLIYHQTQVRQREVAEPGCLTEEAPGRKAGEEERSNIDQVSAQKATRDGKAKGSQGPRDEEMGIQG